MRLFYVIVLFTTLVSFASFASLRKSHTPKIQAKQIVIISQKISFKYHFSINKDDEQLQKDLINHSTLKIFLDAIVVLVVLISMSVPLKTNEIISKRQKYHYWCLLKMLYPKHVFW